MSSRLGRFLTFFAVLALVSACGGMNGNDAGEGRATADKPQAAAPKETYPAPRWPSYFKPPKTVDDLMPAARSLVRNPSGFQGGGFGLLKPGESVLVVANPNADPMVIDAITRALKERQVTPYFKFTYELTGEKKEDVQARQAASRRGRRIEDAGIYQATGWITGQFPDPDVPKKWLKERRPDVYAELFPGETAPAAGGGEDGEGGGGGDAEAPRSGVSVGDGIKAYLKANPKVRGVFWGQGGATGLRRALYPMHDKFLGTFLTDNIWNLQSQMTNYPGDVWQLAEEQILEPLVYTDRIEIKDPEGTDMWSDITPDMADRWSQGAYQRGHLYMFPNQATGRFGYSFVNYPGFQQKWLAREPIARINGVLAGTNGHGGFFPRWEVTFKDGFITGVKGGGAQGQALAEFLQYPGINTLVFPFHKTPGYWYLYEIAFGSHPKTFRHPQALKDSGSTSPERVRSGVIHWGLGIRVWHDPDAPTESKVWADFSKKHNTPLDHGYHTHTYFTTYKVRLRNANKWVNLLEKGRMTSLDNPEVRALASRYGDPDYVLAEDWIPELPGINAPGDYMRDYAPNPGKYALKVVEKANGGSYEHYFPAPGTKPIGGTPTTTTPQ